MKCFKCELFETGEKSKFLCDNCFDEARESPKEKPKQVKKITIKRERIPARTLPFKFHDFEENIKTGLCSICEKGRGAHFTELYGEKNGRNGGMGPILKENPMWVGILQRAVAKENLQKFDKKIPKSIKIGGKRILFSLQRKILDLPENLRFKNEGEHFALVFPLSSREALDLQEKREVIGNDTTFVDQLLEMQEMLNIKIKVADLRNSGFRRVDFSEDWITIFDRTT